MSMTGAEVYGSPRGASAVPAPSAGPASPPTERAIDAADPHDKSDPGPNGWLDDPVVWLVVVAGVATGALGLRFRWWGSGAEVGARVNVGDEAAALLGTTLYAITGIALFKIGASKLEIPGLQRLAAFI